MRIAIDARYLNDSFSGIAKYSENLVTHLSKIDQVNSYVVFIHPSFDRRLRVGDNFQVVRYPARPVSMRTLFSFGRRVKRMKCDFLHSLSPVAPILGVKRKILTIHDLQAYTIEEEKRGGGFPLPSRLPSLFHRATFPHFVRSATWLLSVSQETKNRLVAAFPSTEHKTIVVHSGVESVFSVAPESAVSQLVCKKLSLPPQYILYIGTAKANKNLPRMLRAFSRVRKQHSDLLESLHFILVLGNDSRSPECRRIIAELGLKNHVRLLGPITEEEKQVLYARASILFSVTRDEGFGLPIVEAQAAGLPVIAGDDASLPEVTAGTAILVDPDDEDLMTRLLGETLLNVDRRTWLSEAGKKNVERFSWDETARKVLEIYNLLM